MPNIHTEKFTVPAGGYYVVAIPGNFWHIKQASGPVDVEPDNSISKEKDARAGSKQNYGDSRFTRLRFKNNNANDQVFVKLSIADGDGAHSADEFPQNSATKNRGIAQTALNNGQSVTISGVDSNGNQRKHFTVTLRAGAGGNLLVYNLAANELIAIVSAATTGGGGFREETDDDILIVNNTGGAIQNYGAAPDFAVSQVFFKNAV